MNKKININEILKKNNELEKLCKDLNIQLSAVNTKLQKSELYKSHFFSNITNEIINPFASIIGLTQVIMSTDLENHEAINELITLVHTEAFNLDLQLRNIFYAAEIESGVFSIENCEINILKLLNSLQDSFEYLISKNDFIVNYEFSNEFKNSNYLFTSDPLKLTLIITNILNIIINYSSKSKKLEIITSLEKNNLVIEFNNINNEITTKYIQFIYKKISDINNPNGLNIYSHALALSIVKSILDVFGGNIKFLKNNQTIKLCIPETIGEITGHADNGNEVFF